MKKVFSVFVLSCFLMFGSGVLAFADTINGTITKDNFIQAENPTTNNGGLSVLTVNNVEGESEGTRSIIEFTLPEKPTENAEIEGIKLHFTSIESNSAGYMLHRLLTDFSELGSSWIYSDTPTEWSSAGGDFSGVDYIDWAFVSGTDLTFEIFGEGVENIPYILDWSETGKVIIREVMEDSAELLLFSRESGSGFPTIEVIYSETEPEPEPEPTELQWISPTSTATMVGDLGANIGTSVGSIWQVVLLGVSVPLSFFVIRRIIGLF